MYLSGGGLSADFARDAQHRVSFWLPSKQPADKRGSIKQPHLQNPFQLLRSGQVYGFPVHGCGGWDSLPFLVGFFRHSENAVRWECKS